MPPGANLAPPALRFATTADGSRAALQGARRCCLDRAHNLIVAGAAAKVASKPPSNLLFRRIRVPVQKRPRRNQKARRADTALQRCAFQEALLQRRKSVCSADSLNGGHIRTLRLNCQNAARVHDTAIHENAAGAAVAVI